MNIMGLYVNQCQTSGTIFDFERDLANIRDECFALESLDNKQNTLIDILVLTLPKLDKTCKC